MPTGRKRREIMKDKFFKLNLQLFAEDAGSGEGNPETPPQTDGQDTENQSNEAGKDGEKNADKEKTFTQDEVDAIVKKRLEREKARQEEEKAKAQRLAAMTEAERRAEELREKDEQIAAKDEQIRMMELKEDTIKTLTEEGINLKFISFLMEKDAQTTKDNIDSFKEVFKAEVQAEVEKRIAGTTPRKHETSFGNTDDGDLLEKMRQKRII